MELLHSNHPTFYKIVIQLKPIQDLQKYMKLLNTTTVSILAVIALTITSWHLSITENEPRLLQTYQTNPNRMSLNTGLCAGVQRSNIISQDQISQNKLFKAQLKQSVPIDGNKLINTMLDDMGQVPSILMGNITGLVMFMGAFALGLVLTCICCPCLQCCCCCPDTCPPKCCRQADSELYTRCQLYWPTITLLLALSLAIAGSIYGFSKASGFTKAINNMACSISMIPDDLLNGNVTNDGNSYFSGILTLKNNLNSFSTNSGTINAQLPAFNTASMATTMTSLTNLLNQIQVMDVLSVTTSTTIQYGAIVGSQTSTFPTTYGSYNTGGLLQSYYNYVNSLKTSLAAISTNVDAYLATAAITTSITNAITQLDPIINMLTPLDGQYSSFINLSSFSTYATQGVQIYYSAVIGIASLAMLGAILMAFCQKYKCRYLMYMMCLFMVLFAIVGFLVSTIFSIIIPVVSWTCDYLDVGMKDSVGFDYNFRGLDPTMKNYVSTCMPFGSGNILGTLGVAGITSLTNLNSAFTSFNSLNFPQISANLTLQGSLITNTINDYSAGKIADLLDNSELIRIADHSQFSACNDPVFMADSFIPSTVQTTPYVSCTIPAGNLAGSAQCSSIPIFTGHTGLCYGCMDTSQIFAGQVAPNIYNNLMLRYSSNALCIAFATQLQNVWTNYYQIKQTKLAQIAVPAAASAVILTGVITNVNNLGTSMTTANTSLSAMNALLDSKYGMLGGLNCKVFGQDFERVVNAMCVNMFDAFYVARLGLGIGAFGFLFSMCCIACAGPRHYRQADKLSKVSDEFVKQEQVSLQTLNK